MAVMVIARAVVVVQAAPACGTWSRRGCCSAGSKRACYATAGAGGAACGHVSRRLVGLHQKPFLPSEWSEEDGCCKGMEGSGGDGGYVLTVGWWLATEQVQWLKQLEETP